MLFLSAKMFPQKLLPGLKGRKGDLNQDNFFAVRYGENEILLGVFDGHGPRGEVFSELAALWAPLVTVRDPHYGLKSGSAVLSSSYSSSSSAAGATTTTSSSSDSDPSSSSDAAPAWTLGEQEAGAVPSATSTTTNNTPPSLSSPATRTHDKEHLPRLSSEAEKKFMKGAFENLARVANQRLLDSGHADHSLLSMSGTTCVLLHARFVEQPRLSRSMQVGRSPVAEEHASGSQQENGEGDHPGVVEPFSDSEDTSSCSSSSSQGGFVVCAAGTTKRVFRIICGWLGTTKLMSSWTGKGWNGRMNHGREILISYPFLGIQNISFSAGDSRALLVTIPTPPYPETTTTPTAVVNPLTRDHKPEDELEHQRLKQGWADGSIKKTGFIRKQRVWFSCDRGKLVSGLNMSRSLGDRYAYAVTK